LAQQLVHQRCFAVVHVSDNRDVTNTIHNLKRAGKMQPAAGDVKEWQPDGLFGSMSGWRADSIYELPVEFPLKSAGRRDLSPNAPQVSPTLLALKLFIPVKHSGECL
jgi:hypothetical protein